MRTIFLLLFLFCLKIPFAQTENNVPKDSCLCKANAFLKIPETNNNTTGTVIIEFELDSNCIFKNPTINKSLDIEHDSLTLKAMSDCIRQLNLCMLKQKCNNCKPRKLKQPITYRNIDTE